MVNVVRSALNASSTPSPTHANRTDGSFSPVGSVKKGVLDSVRSSISGHQISPNYLASVQFSGVKFSSGLCDTPFNVLFIAEIW
jgi:hypothetical protein